MNNPFDAHNVSHLSASSINEFIANPSRWLLHVSGFRDNFGSPAMWRGIAVEDAIYKKLYDENANIGDLVNYAGAQFDDRFESAQADGIEVNLSKAKTERDSLKDFVEAGVPVFTKLGQPAANQKKIKLEFEEIPVPIIGYVDLYYDGVVRDIKTTARLPSKMPDSISRQLSIYSAALNAMPIVDYIYVTKTKKEVVTRSVDDTEGHLKVVRRAANAMMDLLAYSSDISQIARLFVPDLDDWRWSDNEREEARKLFRMN